MAAPRLTFADRPLVETGAALLAVPAYAGESGPELGAGASEVAAALGADLGAHLAAEGYKGEPGEVATIAALGRLGGTTTVLVVGLGNREKVTAATFRKAGATVVRRAGKAASIATTIPGQATPEQLGAFAEGARLAAYSFKIKSEPKPSPLESIVIATPKPPSKAQQAALARATTRAEATVLVRDLANTPSLDKTPAWLAKQAEQLAKKTGLESKVWTDADLRAAGFGGILAVGGGSARPPRLIQLDYTPAGRPRRHVVLVGKGITFDSGGLSLKPNEGMTAMKTDMSGGATVIGVLQALPALGVRARVTALVPAAENMPSGSAVRPGDVITHWGGRTVEVLNTDAEGRLVLADALAYAVAELKPDYVVDVATLTGAIGIALGRRTGGLFSNDDRLAEALVAAGEAAGERIWRMPLVDDYRRDLDSPVADLKNVGGTSYGGAITAALFLREFVDGRPWAHLDIAGAARADGDDDEIVKGATGFSARTLLSWLETL